MCVCVRASMRACMRAYDMIMTILLIETRYCVNNGGRGQQHSDGGSI